MEMVVCSLSNKECMVHQCKNCPERENLTTILKQRQQFSEESDIVFKQWETTDRTKLNTLTLSTDEFLELVDNKIQSLTAHSFIAKSQAQYLKSQKKSFSSCCNRTC